MASTSGEDASSSHDKTSLTRAERNEQRKAEQKASREARRADRKFKKQVRRARYKTQQVDDKGAEWRKKAMRVMLVITIFFIVVGLCLFAMGIYGTLSKWANFFGKGPGLSVAAIGLVVVGVALAGYFGAKWDNKWLLLVYFIITALTLIFLVVMGSVAVLDNTAYDNKFSKWWCKYQTEASDAQNEFDCCGYNCPVDRPAEGTCPDGNAPTAPSISTCDIEVPDVCDDTVTYTYKGCKQKALDYMDKRFVPLFMLAFATGVMMFFAVIVSGYLTCRSTVKHVQRERGIEVPENRPDKAAYESLIVEASTAVADVVEVKPAAGVEETKE